MKQNHAVTKAQDKASFACKYNASIQLSPVPQMLYQIMVCYASKPECHTSFLRDYRHKLI